MNLKRLASDVGEFSRVLLPGHALRAYQVDVAREVARLVRGGQGGKAVVVFARQSGKDEMLAQLLSYLLFIRQFRGGNIVVALPTRQQASISRERLLARLKENPLMGEARASGYAVWLGKASARFLSAAPGANVRGETADLLLVANEAQDIRPGIWDARFDPMGASTNAPTLFMGTPWTSGSLLSREMKQARRQGRLWLVDWRRVAEDLPAYGARVAQRIAQFGPAHPFIRTEYECRELDGNGGLFPPERRKLMQGSHPRLTAPLPGALYALLVDVAGSDETRANGGENELRDSTCVTVVQANLTPQAPRKLAFPNRKGEYRQDPETEAPLPARGGVGGEVNLTTEPQSHSFSKDEDGRRKNEAKTADSAFILHPSSFVYRVVQRYLWRNVPLAEQKGRICTLAGEWGARYVVVDATGIGAGLASELTAALGRRVLPFTFSLKSKSDLGWDFLGLIDSGRFLHYAEDGAEDTALFWRQLAAVEYEVLSGPGRLLRWSVPDPALHDDLVMSAALVTALEKQSWKSRTAVGVA